MHSAFNLFVFLISSRRCGHGNSRLAFQLPNKRKVNGISARQRDRTPRPKSAGCDLCLRLWRLHQNRFEVTEDIVRARTTISFPSPFLQLYAFLLPVELDTERFCVRCLSPRSEYH